MARPILEIQYADGISKILKQFSSRMSEKLPDLLQALGKRMIYRFQKNISASHDAAFNKYPKLSRPRRRGHNPSSRPLTDTMKLFNSFGMTIGDNYVIAGDPTEYGVYQDRGTGHIPSRPFLNLDLSPTSNDVPSALLFNFAAYAMNDQTNAPGEFFAGVPEI